MNLLCGGKCGRTLERMNGVCSIPDFFCGSNGPGYKRADQNVTLPIALPFSRRKGRPSVRDVGQEWGARLGQKERCWRGVGGESQQQEREGQQRLLTCPLSNSAQKITAAIAG